MDRRERAGDFQAALLVALDGLRSDIWTALPGIIQSFNAAAMTAVVQPSIQGQIQNQQGAWSNVALPLLQDCPVHFPSGGGFTLTFPIAAGDECLVIFASRCIDAWWSQSGVQPQAELRMHDLSDGFVIPKFWSKPNALSAISAASAQLRSDDGRSYVELAAGHIVNIVAPGGVNVTAGGPVTIKGAVGVLTIE